MTDTYIYPIYTELTECRDCYKCVRSCSTKSIKIENDHAVVIKEGCILCGKCINACPSKAKKVRNDIFLAKKLISENKKVIVSLAPSYKSVFNIKDSQLIASIKKLGFFGVSETSIGADIVSEKCLELIKKTNNTLLISSACPVVVEYIKKYRPEYIDNLTPFHSPLLTHCKFLKEYYKNTFDEEITIIFAGPCIAKKIEADNNPEILDGALSFNDLKTWLAEENIDLNNQEENPADIFIPHNSTSGIFYPVDGGMNSTLCNSASCIDKKFISISGLDNMKNILSKLNKSNDIFLELLACEGGCINGPEIKSGNIIEKRLKIITQKAEKHNNHKNVNIDITSKFITASTLPKDFDEILIKEKLKLIGKYSSKDEINCGGCGYDNCKDFAKALILNKAEIPMCVTYMRQLAQKKAALLLKKMPSAVIMVDDKLRILEANERFAKLFDYDLIYEAKPGLEGVDLKKLVSFYNYFENVLSTNNELNNHQIKYKSKVLNLTIFVIEPNKIISAIISDVTEPSIQKDEIANRAKLVIDKNIKTVQKIAYLLGENASETEIILQSMIDLLLKPENSLKNNRPS